MNTYAQAAVKLKSLGHPVSLSIISFIAKNPNSNVAIVSRNIDQNPPIVARYLSNMAHAGLLARIRENNDIYYSLRDTKILDGIKYVTETDLLVAD